MESPSSLATAETAMETVNDPTGSRSALGIAFKGEATADSTVAPLNWSTGAEEEATGGVVGAAALLTKRRLAVASSGEASLEAFVVLKGTAVAADAAIAGAKGMVKIAKERMPTRKTLKRPDEWPGDKRFMNSPYKTCQEPPRGAALPGKRTVF